MILAHLVTADPSRRELVSLDAWWSRHAAETEGLQTPIDRAIVGAFAADRLGYAFASGYREALEELAPTNGRVTALAVTESGGVKPNAIETKLEGGRLSGHKRFATLASRADDLLVVARVGTRDDGKASLRVVRVPIARDGVTVKPLPALAFAPEIPHAEILLDAVRVAPHEILAGDGWEAYVKPFRTVEDIFVHAALLAYLVAVARRAQLDQPTRQAILEKLLAAIVTTRALASEPPLARATHLALAGAITATRSLVEDVRAATSIASADGDEERVMFERDRPLLDVAGAAREARRHAAHLD